MILLPWDPCMTSCMARKVRKGINLVQCLIGCSEQGLLLMLLGVWNTSISAMTGQLSDKSDVYSFGVVLLELLTGRKPMDYTMPDGQQSLVAWLSQATPMLTDDKVKQCVDPRLKDYPAKQAAKLAAVASLCIQYEGDFRPNMSIVVKALQPLLRTPTPVKLNTVNYCQFHLVCVTSFFLAFLHQHIFMSDFL